MTIPNESTVIVTAIQTKFQNMAKFQATSVFINDWSAFDESESAAPWVLIGSPGLQQSIDDSFDTDTNTWLVPAAIRIPFNDWNPDMTELLELRDEVLLTFTTDRGLTWELDGYISIQNIADVVPTAPIEFVYFSNNATDLPDIAELAIVFTVETKGNC